MNAPKLASLPETLRSAATGIARRLHAGGFQGWLVGGAVRDLALGRDPKDVNIATDARPEDVERLFPGAKDVGRAFGTLIVVEAGLAAQVTTFRSERGYSDARRPDHVEFGASVEEDSRRRDFTCNALYLDPLDGTCLDPQGGLVDLGRRSLRAVGEPRERFREDGLRLLRLARFAADLDLEVEPATLAGAREAAGAIVGVSGERVLAELLTMANRARSARALELLDGLGLLARVLPDVPAAEFG
ncbi:MAG: CCA tRNA nucleotidyltransferase, partial [Planctomycetota bacterium]|nr:CCA tRNA nucleotidyltransferase [Planctomycetota bacterium]